MESPDITLYMNACVRVDMLSYMHIYVETYTHLPEMMSVFKSGNTYVTADHRTCKLCVWADNKFLLS